MPVPASWAGVWQEGRRLLTRSAESTPGAPAFRPWDPYRSKLAAYLLRQAPRDLFQGVRSVLYLGGGHGTTVGHLHDVLPEARIFVVEKSPYPFTALRALAERGDAVRPILADAHLPERYAADVGLVDLLYQDVAQRDQAEIFCENAVACLAPGGRGLLMVKARSITQRASPAAIVARVRERLRSAGGRIRQERDLAPYAREHVALLVDF